MILTDTQLAIASAVRNFAQQQLRPKTLQFEANGGYPPELFEELAELGLMGMTAPGAVGGAGANYVSYALALMEIAAAAIRTRATWTGSHYALNGAKQFITSGKIAGLAIVFAVTDPAAGKKGISAFLVPTDREGYCVDKVEHKLGQGASDTCGLRFENLLIEPALRLGEEGQGYRIALSNLEAGRIGIATQSIGMAKAALDIAIAYAKERQSMGKAIIDHQAVGFRLADLAAHLEAARGKHQGHRHSLPKGSVDGKAGCFRNRRGHLLGRHSDTGWLWLSGRVRTGQDLSRCPRLPDL